MAEQRRQRRVKKKKRNRKLRTVTLIVLVLVILGLALLLNVGRSGGQAGKSDALSMLPEETGISILCVGDIMSHSPQTSAQYSGGKYDYRENFEYVKPYIEAADLALCNVETTFAGAPYTGYPAFCSPDALAVALKDAGFDIGITSNNHMADKGYNGVIRTQKVLQEQGLATVGSVLEPDDPRYIITEVKGIKIGIVAYTYETGSGSGPVSINGANITDQTASVINSFNFNTIGEDMKKIKADIDGAKEAGAEIVIVYYHWGEEYQEAPNGHQVNLAQQTADMGADIIFASHPHVLQKADYVTVTGSNKQVPVFYSMGNFISNQRTETLGKPRTEQGVMAMINLSYMEGVGITILEMDAVATWVDKYSAGGSVEYRIIPLDKDLESNASLKASGHMSRAKQAMGDAYGILGLSAE